METITNVMPKMTTIRAACIALLLTGGELQAQSPSQPKHVQETCERAGTISVANGAYIVQNNEWSSTARACIASDRSASFTVTTSEIDNPMTGVAAGLPGSF